jgi:hypothetical protein
MLNEATFRSTSHSRICESRQSICTAIRCAGCHQLISKSIQMNVSYATGVSYRAEDAPCVEWNTVANVQWDAETAK